MPLYIIFYVVMIVRLESQFLQHTFKCSIATECARVYAWFTYIIQTRKIQQWPLQFVSAAEIADNPSGTILCRAQSTTILIS